MTVNDARKDILDEGILTANGSSDVNGNWVSTKDANTVVVLLNPSVAASGLNLYLEESNDQSTILRVNNVGVIADATGNNASGTVVPGAAFVRVVFGSTTNGRTLNYSVRAVA